MTTPAIRVRNLGKEYQLGTRERGYATFREALTGFVKAPLDRFRRLSGRNSADESFWALNDVSFDIHEGEVVGIIGRNGAGKSTLLKILSQITEPTTGEVELHGRVGSLLEVGTGFHPELTGRENIYLNGAILGMRRAEIRRRFDEIVAFAEVEKFLDTPVKRYSSGMHVRLAFAVAAHLEPETLIVDEVLAVGDAEFQKKCLGKMESASKSGRTVIIVSHHTPSLNRICQRGILIEKGEVRLDGPIHEVTSRYLRSQLGSGAQKVWQELSSAPGDSVARLKSVRVLQDGQLSETVDIRKPVALEMEYWNLREGARLLSAFTCFNDEGIMLFCTANFSAADGGAKPLATGIVRAVCQIPGNIFAESRVRVLAEVSTREPMYCIHILEYDAVSFQVVDTGEPGSVRSGWGRPIPGVMRPRCNWSFAAGAE